MKCTYTLSWGDIDFMSSLKKNARGNVEAILKKQQKEQENLNHEIH